MYQVEEVLNFRTNPKTNHKEYLVKWAGYGEQHNTWEPIKHLQYCQSLLQQFHHQQSLKNSSTLKEDEGHHSNSSSQQKSQGEKKLDNLKTKLIKKLKSTKMEKSAKKEQLFLEKQPQIPQNKLKILKVGEKKDNQNKKYFKIEIDSEVKWVDRDFLMPKYAVEYCEFLEEHAAFIKNDYNV